MRISVKGRYALASVIKIAEKQQSESRVTVMSIAEELDISKIYLEQMFAQLKKAGIVVSAKGPKGGYQLAYAPAKLSVWDVLSAVETLLSEETEPTVADSDPGIEMALKTVVFDRIDETLRESLSGVSVQDLYEAAASQREEQSYMMGL